MLSINSSEHRGKNILAAMNLNITEELDTVVTKRLTTQDMDLTLATFFDTQ